LTLNGDERKKQNIHNLEITSLNGIITKVVGVKYNRKHCKSFSDKYRPTVADRTTLNRQTPTRMYAKD